MARPRIFVSSTYYDLKHVRSSLDNFIDALGFDSVLSEKGDIAFSPDVALDESCYREAASADIFVLIVGGRYGSPTSAEEKKPSRSFFERYDSITRKEYESATERDIPIYILIEQNVYAEYHTYLRNKDNRNIQYAHVDSVNVFDLIQGILGKPRNNPVHTFERFSDIESWLREQWAGLFRELLQRMSGQKQLASLSAQVQALSAINATLQKYLETVVTKVAPEEGKELIKSERKRLSDIEQVEALRRNPFLRGAFHPFGTGKDAVSAEDFRQALLGARSFEDFALNIGKFSDPGRTAQALEYKDHPGAISDVNQARTILGLSPFPLPGLRPSEPAIAKVKAVRSKKSPAKRRSKKPPTKR